MDLQAICQTVFLSFIIIFLCHYLFYYLQASFTVPKVKDMINRPNEKYESIMKVVHSESTKQEDMKNELNTFINELSPNDESNIKHTETSQSNVPIASNDFDNAELVYKPQNNTSTLEPTVSPNNDEPDTTPISQLNTY
tara:strand:+ start:114 stop:530 length:417 start_codon:yes stop_codon:yes gene_type:complete